MKLLCGFILGGLLAFPFQAHASLNVFACEPEWASLARELGGDDVEVFAATHAHQDPHHIRARPSLIAKARSADIIICSGASLEIGWLPILLEKAGAKVQPGTLGYIMAANHVSVLEKPVRVDRSMGDVHPDGNPHVHLNPENISVIADILYERMTQINPGKSDLYAQQYNHFRTRWDAAQMRWKEQTKNLAAKKVAVHHRSFSYLLDWLGMEAVVSLEPKPGIAPTTSHLENLLIDFQTSPVQAVLRTPYEPEEASIWYAEKTGVPAVVLPYTIGGDRESSDLFSLFERSINLLKHAI